MSKATETASLANLPEDVRQQLGQLERMRRDFVANVSHELRTPLTVIRGYLESFVDNDEPSLEKWQKIFQQMFTHTLRMEHIVADLLLLSRLENHETFALENRVPVAQILTALREDAEHVSASDKHKITLEADPKLAIDGVAEELKSLFSNLIINAVKYTPQQGQIHISWQLESGQAVFQVTDTGIGIADKDIPRITERFYRVDKGRSRDKGGTGLGLAIAKHVLIRHDAELTIVSKLGEGSTFCCTFPKAITHH